MKATTMATLAFGLIAGFALGGIAPRRELGALQKRHEKLEQELAEAERPSFMSRLLPRLSEAVQAPPVPSGAGGVPKAAPAAPPAIVAASDVDVSTGDAGIAAATPDVVVVGAVPEHTAERPPVVTSSTGPGGAPVVSGDVVDSAQSRRPTKESMLAGFDQAATAQSARAAATRAALIEQAKLNPAQVKALDQSVTSMNKELASYGEQVLALMESEESPSAKQALDVGHKVSGVLLEHQSHLDALLSGAQGKGPVDEKAKQVWNLVDFEAFRPAVERRMQSAAGSGQSAPTGTAGAPATE